MPDAGDRLPDEPERRFSEGQEDQPDTAEKDRIGDFASREASSQRIGPLGEPVHDRLSGEHADHGDAVVERPGSVSGDALDATDRRAGHVEGGSRAGSVRGGSGDDQEDRPEQERHRRFSEGQEHGGETPEKERQGDFATGQREHDDD